MGILEVNIKSKLMKLARCMAVLAFIGLLMGCATTQVSEADDQALQAMIDGKSFEIISQSASPQNTVGFNAIANAGLLAPGNTAGLINLIGNTNYLKVRGDTISAYLPYYGEQRIGGTYGTRRGGIEFEGIPSDYVVTKGKKSVREIRFNIRDKEQNTEQYQVRIEIYPNLSSNINVNSSHRTTILYRGEASELKKEP